jgi:4-cresol dehydrogenase (hydroxylating)
MRLTLPDSVSATEFDRVMHDFRRIVGEAFVFATEDDRDAYMDAYAFGDGSDHLPAAAVAPQSVEEVQAILRIAGERKVPLWPISRGKNLGYGGSAPLLSGSVVLDLSRMNRIIEAHEKRAYAVIEPGVGFLDLHNHLRDNKIPLWVSVPGHGAGSVLGNALERGFGYTAYGDHTSKLCGLEVVLPTGELVRTGMGAMANSKTWNLYQYGFGPHWDQLFVQSNLGVVTKAGLWLMPEPETTVQIDVHLPAPADIGWAIDVLARLRLHNVIDSPVVFGNFLRNATVFSRRDDWYAGPGAIPEPIAQRIMAHFGTGWWSATVRLCGHEAIVKSQVDIVRLAFEPHLKRPLTFSTWHRGEPFEKSAAGIPNLIGLQIVNWPGGRGGHIGFSPVIPPDGALALAQFRRMKQRYEEYGLDYYTSFTIGQRHISNINLIIYDRDDPRMTGQVRKLLRVMALDAAAEGYGEYRTHLTCMQAVADTYDFNDHALRRLAERVKDVLDPNGILAPGKNGIWPRSYRDQHAK